MVEIVRHILVEFLLSNDVKLTHLKLALFGQKRSAPNDHTNLAVSKIKSGGEKIDKKY